MQEQTAEAPPEKETGRLEAFSDGVFAIAITLLVLELKVPDLSLAAATSASLGKALLAQWPSYIGLVTSFFTILIMWIHHHALFSRVVKCDAWVHFANGCLLLVVTFVPYPTSVLARYLESPAASMAVAFYCGTFVLIAVCYNLVLRAASREKLLLPSTPMEFVEKTCRNYLVGPPLYLLALGAAFVDIRLSLLIVTLLWIFWAATTREERA